MSLRPRALPKLRAQSVRQLASLTEGGSPFMLPAPLFHPRVGGA